MQMFCRPNSDIHQFSVLFLGLSFLICPMRQPNKIICQSSLLKKKKKKVTNSGIIYYKIMNSKLDIRIHYIITHLPSGCNNNSKNDQKFQMVDRCKAWGDFGGFGNILYKDVTEMQ